MPFNRSFKEGCPVLVRTVPPPSRVQQGGMPANVPIGVSQALPAESLRGSSPLHPFSKSPGGCTPYLHSEQLPSETLDSFYHAKTAIICERSVALRSNALVTARSNSNAEYSAQAVLMITLRHLARRQDLKGQLNPTQQQRGKVQGAIRHSV